MRVEARSEERRARTRALAGFAVMPCAALEYFVATSLLFQKSLEADEAAVAVWDMLG